MAGGSFGQQSEAAERFSNSLSGVAQQAGILTSAVTALSTAMHALAVTWAQREIELTAQAFYKLRLQLGATQKGALDYVKSVRTMTDANVLSRRSLVELYGEMRKSSGLISMTDKELAVLTTRLQKEFPQAAKEAALAIADMADKSPNFQAMMSKNVSSTTAFAIVNARFGSEYARAFARLRGDLSDFTEKNKDLVTMFAEVKTSADNMTQSLADSLKAPVSGILTLVKGLADAVRYLNELGGGEFGKAVAPVLAAGAAALPLYVTKKFGDKLTRGKDGGGPLSGLLGGRGLTPAMPLFVQVVGTGQIPVGGTQSAGTTPIPGLIGGPAEKAAPKGIRSLPGRAWKGMGGGFGALTAAAGVGMTAANAAGQYQSVRQGESFGVGGMLASAGTGAIAGAMIGSVVPVLGTALGALTGAVVGLTSAVIMAKLAMSENAEESFKSARMHATAAEEEDILAQAITKARSQAGPNLREQRLAEASTLQSRVRADQYTIEDRREYISSGYRKIRAIEDIHSKAGFFDTTGEGGLTGLSDEQTKFIMDNNITLEGGANQLKARLEQAIVEIEKEMQATSEQVAAMEGKNILRQQRSLALATQNYEVGVRRSGVIASQVGIAERGLTLEEGPRSVAALKQMMLSDVGFKRQALQDYQQGIVSTLSAAGADTQAVFGGRTDEEQLGILRSLGTMSEADFVEQAKSLGISEKAARGLLLVYEDIPDYAQKLADLEQQRAKYLDDNLHARTVDLDIGMKLLDVEQRRIDSAQSIASALKASPMIQAKLTADSIKATEMQIVLEEKRLEEMRKSTDGTTRSIIEQREQVAKIDGLYGQLANQVDYIRRGWEEVFTQQSLNLPGGSYILPTMTGLMEKGPSFLPFTPNQMTEDARLMGHGTYESYMGYGKASAFSKLQEHLQAVMSGMAGNIEYVTDGLATLGDRLSDMAGTSKDAAGG
jgi:hypothetical protein